MAYRVITTETSRAVQLLNRPERLNAWRPAMSTELADMEEAFTANPDPQLPMMKSLLTNNSCATDLEDIERAETHLLRQCWPAPAHKEAVSAFLEKRPPKFR